jgi:hypothetical protein
MKYDGQRVSITMGRERIPNFKEGCFVAISVERPSSDGSYAYTLVIRIDHLQKTNEMEESIECTGESYWMSLPLKRGAKLDILGVRHPDQRIVATANRNDILPMMWIRGSARDSVSRGLKTYNQNDRTVPSISRYGNTEILCSPKNDEYWVEGRIKDGDKQFVFWAKQLDTRCALGLRGGKIVVLYLYDADESATRKSLIAAYKNRDWEIDVPLRAREACRAVIKTLN